MLSCTIFYCYRLVPPSDPTAPRAALTEISAYMRDCFCHSRFASIWIFGLSRALMFPSSRGDFHAAQGHKSIDRCAKVQATPFIVRTWTMRTYYLQVRKLYQSFNISQRWSLFNGKESSPDLPSRPGPSLSVACCLRCLGSRRSLG